MIAPETDELTHNRSYAEIILQDVIFLQAMFALFARKPGKAVHWTHKVQV
jgi:hypothetical protein